MSADNKIMEVMELADEFALKTDAHQNGEASKEEMLLARRAIKTKLRALLPGWQPIETAPKDGEEFLGFKPGTGFVVACYLDERHPDHDGCDFYLAWDFHPMRGMTHWMPLPAEPTEGAT